MLLGSELINHGDGRVHWTRPAFPARVRADRRIRYSAATTDITHRANRSSGSSAFGVML